jgi:A/G-specific adenine glycosylase
VGIRKKSGYTSETMSENNLEATSKQLQKSNLDLSESSCDFTILNGSIDVPNECLRAWFLKNRRDFPWRQDPQPYKVWISEVMLQQTRANVVVSYFEQWMTLFPNVAALARAPLEVLLKAWEGLGYYSRLRNIHRSAQIICEKFRGNIPESEEDLKSLPGLGPYTRGAILAFGFRKRAAAVDGNAMRAMSRYFQIAEDLSKESSKKKLFVLQESLLPEKDPQHLVEAWIELGAVICRPKPLCESCPLENSCLAHLSKKETLLPFITKKKEVTLLRRAVLVVEKDRSFLLRKGKKGEIMEDLFEFPYFSTQNGKVSRREVALWARAHLGLEIEEIRPLGLEKQSFTSFRACLFPFMAVCSRLIEKNHSYEWIAEAQLAKLSFSSGHRRILQKVMEGR